MINCVLFKRINVVVTDEAERHQVGRVVLVVVFKQLFSDIWNVQRIKISRGKAVKRAIFA